jgi:hypothetical protein
MSVRRQVHRHRYGFRTMGQDAVVARAHATGVGE